MESDSWDLAVIQAWIETQLLTHTEVARRLGCKRQQVGLYCKQKGIRTQRTGPRGGSGHPEWKGGRNQDLDGYWIVHKPDHPSARKNGYVLEHRLVMEASIGRHLLPQEVVHHMNGKRGDNRIENLELFSSNADHLRHELTGHVPKWTADGIARMRAGHPGPRGGSKRDRERAARQEAKLQKP